MPRLSTGLRNAMLATDGVQGAMEKMAINIYSGTRPASSNDVVPGAAVLLATIQDNGTDSTGLSFDAPAEGVLAKAAAETWTGEAAATGNATWARAYKVGDNPATASTTLARMDVTVGVSGAELQISNTAITQGAIQTVQQLNVTMPAGS